MFEQKKTTQNEHIMTCLCIESPEVGDSSVSDHDELLLLVHTDSRSRVEIFESLKNRIKRDASGKLNESQAIEATRNLLNFFETILQSYNPNQDNRVDKQRVNGNVVTNEI